MASLTLLSKAKSGMYLKTRTYDARSDKTPIHRRAPKKSNMEILVLATAFLLRASTVSGKYIYVDKPMGWLSAQNYCRDYYVDLASIQLNAVRKSLFGKDQGEFWIGLYRDGNQWMWSSGAKAANLQWADYRSGQNRDCGSFRWRQSTHGLVYMAGFKNVRCDQDLPFLCYNLIVPQHKATWEQALTFCKMNHTALTSLQSKNKHLLALRKVQKGPNERVWIGLRFLPDQWMWIDGQRFGYEAWNKDQDHSCPALNRCGTLTRSGQWESWDCKDQLPVHFLCH